MQMVTGRIQRRGFSLIELSIVLVIMGVLVASSLSLGSAQLEVMDVKSTQTKLQQIEDALQYYYNVNRSIPCPANGSTAIGNSSFGAGGKTNPTANSTKSDSECPNATAFQSGTLYIGVVPTKDLGLSDDFMFDSWGNRISYTVTKHCVDPDNWSESNTYRCSNNLSASTNGAALEVNDLNGNKRNEFVLYALISHGKNGVGAWRRSGGSRIPSTASTSSMEMQNAHVNTSGATTGYDEEFVDGFINNGNVAAKYFDDVVRWKTPVMFFEEMITVMPDGSSTGCGITTHNTSNHYYPCATNENPVTLTGTHNNVFGEMAGFKLTTGADNNLMGSHAGMSITTGINNNMFGHRAGHSTTTGGNNNMMGGYAGFNNTTGWGNNFFGERAGESNTTGSNNLFMGGSAGRMNSEGVRNIYMGGESGYNSTNTEANIFMGNRAGYDSTTSKYNVFLGDNAGYKTTTAVSNIGIGVYAGYNNLTGEYNNYIGWQAGGNTAGGATTGTGNYNNFFGKEAGYTNTAGYSNNFIGYQAGYRNTIGFFNNAFGHEAGYSLTSGSNNIFMGNRAGYSTTTGGFNNFLGRYSGNANTTGAYNNFLGSTAGNFNTTGYQNNFIGRTSGYLNTTGIDNTFIGSYAGSNNTTGSNNVAIGPSAGGSEAPGDVAYLTGSRNAFIGYRSGQANEGGTSNVFIGDQSGYSNITGSNNVYIGTQAGMGGTGGGNVAIGSAVEIDPGITNATAIGAGSRAMASNVVILGRIDGGGTLDNVGIGTGAPAERLHVVGNVRISGGDLRIDQTIQTNVGAAGTATVLPRPTGYLKVNVNGTLYKVPLITCGSPC